MGIVLKKIEGFELFDPKFEIIHELKQKQAKKNTHTTTELYITEYKGGIFLKSRGISVFSVQNLKFTVFCIPKIV